MHLTLKGICGSVSLFLYRALGQMHVVRIWPQADLNAQQRAIYAMQMKVTT